MASTDAATPPQQKAKTKPCWYGSRCHRKNCIFAHPPPESGDKENGHAAATSAHDQAVPPPTEAKPKGKPAGKQAGSKQTANTGSQAKPAEDTTNSKKSKKNATKPCRNGSSCNRANCPFMHPAAEVTSTSEPTVDSTDAPVTKPEAAKKKARKNKGRTHHNPEVDSVANKEATEVAGGTADAEQQEPPIKSKAQPNKKKGPKKTSDGPAPPASKPKAKASKARRPKCRYGENCERPNCPFQHPPAVNEASTETPQGSVTMVEAAALEKAMEQDAIKKSMQQPMWASDLENSLVAEAIEKQQNRPAAPKKKESKARRQQQKQAEEEAERLRLEKEEEELHNLLQEQERQRLAEAEDERRRQEHKAEEERVRKERMRRDKEEKERRRKAAAKKKEQDARREAARVAEEEELERRRKAFEAAKLEQERRRAEEQERERQERLYAEQQELERRRRAFEVAKREQEARRQDELRRQAEEQKRQQRLREEQEERERRQRELEAARKAKETRRREEQERKRQARLREEQAARKAEETRRREEQESKLREAQERLRREEEEEERERYKAERKAAKKERRRLEREAKAAEKEREAEAEQQQEAKQEPQQEVAGDALRQSPTGSNRENVDDFNTNHDTEQVEEDEEARKRRWQEELRLQKERAAEKKEQKQKLRRERFLEDLERQFQERTEFWQKEIADEQVTVEMLVQLLASEFCRKNPGVDRQAVLSHGDAKAKLEEAAQETYRVICKSDIHSRVVVRGMKQQDLNDRTGTIERWDEGKAKFYVGLDTKKGKNVQFMYFLSGNLEALPNDSGRRGKKKGDPVHMVFIASLYKGKQLMTDVYKSELDTMKKFSSPDEYLVTLMKERDEEERLAKETEEEERRQEEEARHRRAEQRRRENEEWEEQKREYAERKREYQEWRRQERKEQKRSRKHSGGGCNCPQCQFERMFFRDMGGGMGPGGFFFSFGRSGIFFDFGFDDDEDYDYDYDYEDEWDREWNRRHEEEEAEKDAEAAETLGVEDDATEAEIKRVYRRKALKYHPDKYRAENHEDGMTKAEAEEHFKELTNAYDHLMSKFDDDTDESDA